MATIEIDGKSYQAQPGQMLIEITDANGIHVPRFCYHKKLSVSANCRMCLVEVEKAPKPMPACATPVADGMKVHTRSSKALAAQKAVMEFLLINHPLDCPICDQGGECELQDVAVGYGGNVSWYREGKRVVADKDIGPLIATEMTRCIHCTRCVRFGVEVAGIQELGATGRGEHTRIGTYIETSLNSELSGNVIDLCPVGALTSKPFRFAARAWEMQQYPSVAPHDAVGSNLKLHVRRGELMRVAPRENEAVNEVWISDRDRFSYLGLRADDRLRAPMIKENGTWRETDWETALVFAADGIKQSVARHGAEALGALATPNSTLEELYLLQKLVRGIGSNNLDHRLHQVDFSDQNQAPLFPWLGQSIADLEQVDAALLVGSHLRKEQPLLNQRLRKAVVKNHAQVMLVNPLDYEFNYPLAEKIIVSPAEMLNHLAGIAKALLEAASDPGAVSAGMQKLLGARKLEISPAQRAIADTLRAANTSTVLLGRLASSHPQASVLRALAATIAILSGSRLGYAGEAANTAGACLAGMLPHRRAGGQGIKSCGRDAFDMLSQPLPVCVLMGLEPELDSCLGEVALHTLNQADFVISLSAYHSPVLESYANVLLPIALFAETSGTYVNCEGRWQDFAGVVPPPGEARPAWKILRVLGNLFALEGFEYMESSEVAAELRAQIETDKLPDALTAWRNPAVLESPVEGIQRITELSAYATDALVRRSGPLQQTADALMTGGVRLHPETARQLGLHQQQAVSVRQDNAEAALQVRLDSRVPPGCALIYAGPPEHIQLGPWHGQVQIQPVSV